MLSKIDREYILQDFKLSDWINAESKLLKKMRDVFDNDVEDDFYDVRRDQITFFADKSILDEEKRKELFLTYYANGDESLIREYVETLSPSDKKVFDLIQPYRQRAFAEIVLRFNERDAGTEPKISISPPKDFVQESSDYRNLPRRFATLSKDLLNYKGFIGLVIKVARDIKEKVPTALELKFEFHVMRLLVRNDPKTNTPEGKHQDDADYIIMFIANRQNVEGGVSKVFEKTNDGTFVLKKEILLKAGQGLFMSDASSNLFHEVSPCSLVDKSK
ncbi:2OG-Fe dioxygenase family protein, partial [Patescibacteria group bacterium AH-259-L07]|nr:2OG-Fe dioxygenase family protein [Patescibacteria group bacterium AH-259-L07]